MNRSIARKWMSANTEMLTNQFAQVGAKDGGRLIRQIHDGADRFYTFVTGRRNIVYGNISLKMFPRHDPFTIVLDTIGSVLNSSMYEMPADRVEGELLISEDYDKFIWAIVHKNHLRKLRSNRYDLGFTKTSDHKGMGKSFSVMTEVSEITDIILAKLPDLVTTVAACDRILDYVILTDQPEEIPSRPDNPPAPCRIIIKYHMSKSPQGMELGAKLLEQTFLLADVVEEKGRFRQDITKRLVTARDEASKKIRKAFDKDPNIIAQDRKAEKERLEKERISKLSAADQKKALQKEKERRMKKEMGKRTQK